MIEPQVTSPTSLLSYTRARATNLKLHKFKSTMGKVSFMYAAATEWNKLPLEMKEVQNAQTFKKKVMHKRLDNASR